MQDPRHWLLDARTVQFVLALFGVAVVLYAIWRSRGEAKPDPIRESGPIR